ncbi:hypothetical protein ACKKBG_A13020 [Auxenochlorella protothecoides x Auxenochlorella symbiontica]
MGDGLKATPVLRPINSNLAAVSGWGKGTVDGSRAPRAVAHRPHSRRDGIPLRPGTGRQPSKVRLSVRLRVDAWQAGEFQLDSDELKDTILFQATRQRAAALQISLRQGSGRHHVRRPTQVALPPLPPPPPEVTEEETVLQEEEGAAAASVAGMAAEGQARPAATPPVQLAPHPSPACTMPASSQGRPSRSQTRVEGVPEWFTAARGKGPRRSAPLHQPRATPRPAFTPVEGVPERDSVAGPGAGWPRGWLHMAGGGADAGDGDPATASTGRARSAEGRRGSLDRTLDMRTPEPGDPAPPQPQPGPVPQSDDDDDDNCDFGGQEYGDGWDDHDDGGGDPAQDPTPFAEVAHTGTDAGAAGPTPRPALTPAPAPKPRRQAQRHSPGHRLRNELGKRKSLSSAPGIGRYEIAPGIRRSSRAPERPLMWWLGENKEYSRSAHKTMPTIRAIIHHDPNTPWQTVTDPFPGARKRRDALAAAKLEARLDAAGDAVPPAAEGEAEAAASPRASGGGAKHAAPARGGKSGRGQGRRTATSSRR